MADMPFEQLEQAYEALARAIDTAGPQQEGLFLAKLALTMAHKSGDISTFREAIAIALQDLCDPGQADVAKPT